MHSGTKTIVDDDTYEAFGHLAWSLHTGGYVFRQTRLSDGKRGHVYLHRLVTLARKGEETHHLNGNRLDNRRENLEVRSGRSHRSEHTKVNGPRGGKRYRGVYHYSRTGTKQWTARMVVNGRLHSFGYFASPEEAARAWDEGARRILGPGCYQNFPDG